jgi:isocitrate lyase
MDKAQMKTFQAELGAMGYKYQFITLAGFHNQCFTTFELARRYREDGMAAYSELQQREFKAAEERGFTTVKHQREVGAGYFDRIATTVDPNTSTAALKGSTEEGQFH